MSWKGNLVPSLSTIVSLSFLNNFELCYRGTSFKVQGGSVIAAVFLAYNYVSEQFGNYVEYGITLDNCFKMYFRPNSNMATTFPTWPPYIENKFTDATYHLTFSSRSRNILRDGWV